MNNHAFILISLNAVLSDIQAERHGNSSGFWWPGLDRSDLIDSLENTRRAIHGFTSGVKDVAETVILVIAAAAAITAIVAGEQVREGKK